MAAGSTYTPIATQTLGSAASSVTFSSISQGYTDLILVSQTSISSGSANFVLQFNSDTGSNYSSTHLSGTGSVAVSTRFTSATSITITNYGYLETTLGSYITQIQNYSNNTTYKTVLARANTTSNGVNACVGLWRSTAAINSINIFPSTSTFPTGSTFSIYGILAA
jgi:hypothetical protein